MSTSFKVGDRIKHTYAGKVVYATVIGIDEYIHAIPEQDIYPHGWRTFKEQRCYTFQKEMCTLAGPPLSKEEQVLAKIKYLTEKYETRMKQKKEKAIYDQAVRNSVQIGQPVCEIVGGLPAERATFANLARVFIIDDPPISW